MKSYGSVTESSKFMATGQLWMDNWILLYTCWSCHTKILFSSLLFVQVVLARLHSSTLKRALQEGSFHWRDNRVLRFLDVLGQPHYGIFRESFTWKQMIRENRGSTFPSGLDHGENWWEFMVSELFWGWFVRHYVFQFISVPLEALSVKTTAPPPDFYVNLMEGGSGEDGEEWVQWELWKVPHQAWLSGGRV